MAQTASPWSRRSTAAPLCLAVLLGCPALLQAQPQTTRQHPDYARVPLEVAREAAFPAGPRPGATVYGFTWERAGGYGTENVWGLDGGHTTRRLRVDANKNGQLEANDPIREEVWVHYYVATAVGAMRDIDKWLPPADPFPDPAKRLPGPDWNLVSVGDFACARQGTGAGTCFAERGPARFEANVSYRVFREFLSRGVQEELSKAGIRLWKYLDEAEFSQATAQAATRCSALATDVVRQMVAKWDPYYRDRLLPGNGFKGMYVSLEPYKLAALDLPSALSPDPKRAMPEEGDLLWPDPLQPSRGLERYHYSLTVRQPSQHQPLGRCLDEARQAYEANYASPKHPFPVDLPGVDQVSRDVHRDQGTNTDSIAFRLGNMVVALYGSSSSRSIEAPTTWTPQLAQALRLKLTGRAVPAEAWQLPAPDMAAIGRYRMVRVQGLSLPVDTTRGTAGGAARRETIALSLGWIGVAEGDLPLPSKYVQQASWQGLDFSFTYAWASGGNTLSGTAKGSLADGGRSLARLVVHEVAVRKQTHEGISWREKTESHLEAVGTQLVGPGQETMDTFAHQVFFARSQYSDATKPGRLQLEWRQVNVSNEPTAATSGECAHITFCR